MGRRGHVCGFRSIDMNASTGGQVRNVVLVHGAYADGSSWSEVIARLQAARMTATAVQNPLGSLADDVAHTRRILAMQDGPTIRAGHSSPGPLSPKPGPTHTSSVWCMSPPEHRTRARTMPRSRRGSRRPLPTLGWADEHGFGGLTEHAFLNDFANGVDSVKARALYAVQGRISDVFSRRGSPSRRGGQSHAGTPSRGEIAPPPRNSSASLPTA